LTESKIYWGVEVPQRVDLRKFGLVMAAVLALVSGYLWYKDAMDPAQVVFSVAAGFLIVGLVLPVVLTPIYFPWMWLARILAFVNTHLLLGFVFYTYSRLSGWVCVFWVAIRSIAKFSRTATAIGSVASLLCFRASII